MQDQTYLREPQHTTRGTVAQHPKLQVSLVPISGFCIFDFNVGCI
jgi:hypothetical protein